MILSRLILGMIQGVSRPAICSNIPNKNSFCLMMDLGANVYVNAENLLQFALMGYSYFSIIDPTRKPKVGLINIGTENNKGLEFLQEAHDLLHVLLRYMLNQSTPKHVHYLKAVTRCHFVSPEMSH